MQYPNSLEPHQVDLLELANLAGIVVKPQILRLEWLMYVKEIDVYLIFKIP